MLIYPDMLQCGWRKEKKNNSKKVLHLLYSQAIWKCWVFLLFRQITIAVYFKLWPCTCHFLVLKWYLCYRFEWAISFSPLYFAHSAWSVKVYLRVKCVKGCYLVISGITFVRILYFVRRDIECPWSGANAESSVKSHFDSKFHFHGKFWIYLINLGYRIYPEYLHTLLFILYFSSTSPFYYLKKCVKLLGEWQTVQTLIRRRIWAWFTLFAQACLSEYVE